MGRRAGAAAHLARDAVVTVFSVLLIATAKGSEEMAAAVLQIFGATFIVLSIVDMVLVVAKRQARGFFIGNAVYQIIASLLLAGIYPPAGVPMLTLNVVALVPLRGKKTAEELALHPPLPRTRNYKVVAGVGTLVIAAALFLPWVSATDGTISLLGLYGRVAGNLNLPGVAISPVGVVFAILTLFLSPVAPVVGALALRWRRLAIVAGVFGFLGGTGIVVAATSVVAIGAYVFMSGGVLLLVGHFGFRKRPTETPQTA